MITAGTCAYVGRVIEGKKKTPLKSGFFMQHVDPVEMCEARVECFFLLLSWRKEDKKNNTPLTHSVFILERITMKNVKK